jgi:hypothetical protein
MSSKSESRGDGGGEPPLERLLTAEEGPMRRELLRQIAVLEARLSGLQVEEAMWQPVPAAPRRSPALLATDQLEQVRDELLAVIAELQDGIAQRFSAELNATPDAGRLRRLLRRARRR